MRLLEYQAKELFAEYGIRLLDGAVCRDVGEAREAAGQMGYPVVIKSQVPVGGRGKAGGIQKCSSPEELEIKFPEVLNMTIKGEQTRTILVEKAATISSEIYLALMLNRGTRTYTVIASSEGGVEIESVKDQTIREIGLNGVDAATCAEIATEIGLKGDMAASFVKTLESLSRLAMEKEAELAEINPLAIVDGETMTALDGKVITDDNSNFRHPELQKYREVSELEDRATARGFSLVEMDGDIAVVGNGAGLVMSTFDMLSDSGGKPSCFLDVGGGATVESVYEAVTLISKMHRTRAILVNLYGGIVRTTTVATAFLKAYGDGTISLPTFARLKGAESDKAKEMLDGSQIEMFDTVEEAINAAVRGAKRR